MVPGVLHVNTLLTRFLQHGLDTLFVDRFQRFCGYLQGDPAIFVWNVKSLFLQVALKPTLLLVIGARYGITRYRAFARQIVFPCHSEGRRYTRRRLPPVVSM